MEVSWGRGLVLPLAVVVVLATLAHASDEPNYKCFSFSKNSLGTVIPTGDIVREVGHSYEAFCLFDPRYIKAEDVYFMHWGKTPEDQYRINHTVYNESAIHVQITHQEGEEYKLKCQTGNDTFLCERTVKIGYIPQDVDNFTCISENWQALNCTWAVPDNPVIVNYYLSYVVLGFLDTRECPTTQNGINECIWEGSDFNLRDEWVVTFTATNKLKEEGVKYEHKVNTYSVVIPNPPVKLEAKVNGPHEVNLTWQLPHPIDVFDGGVIQEVSYRQRQDGDQSEDVPWILVQQWKVIPHRFIKETFSKAISDLHAYIHYDFRVRLHTGTGPIREHMWSDAAIRTERTAATRPTKTPMTGIGTFGIEETLSHRDIYINWQKVDRLFWNGRNFHYSVRVLDNGKNSPINKSSQEVDIKDTYAKFSNMEKDIAYRFEIRPVNDEGPPVDEDTKSVVVVPEMDAVLKPLSYFKVIAFSNASSTVYSLRWRLPENHQDQKIETVTLYWCKKDKYEVQCLNKLEWLTVEDPSISVKNLTDLENSSLYMFGISVNSHNSSSGIKWITCIASHGERPPPLEEFLVAHALSKEVKLKWGLDCKAKAAEPTGFNISYCSVAENIETCPPESEKTYEEVSDETADEHLIKNLHPYTNYIFNIAILTEIGLSKWSSSVKVKTKPDKPSGPPVHLNATQKGQEWVLLSWEPPVLKERNGKLVNYIITSEPPVINKRVKANTASDVTTYNVTGLEPYSKYKFKVIPCTEVERVAFCGDIAANVTERTKIGVPGKIESIDQEDDHLEWEHDECNGPECSYELQYRMNGSNHVYRIVSNQSAINFRDLNITCTDRQEDIIINMSAISEDEDGLVLTGPWKEKKITCPVSGSNSYDHVPSISVNPYIILVQFPPRNQYNTILNLLRIPYAGKQQNPLSDTDSMRHDPVGNVGSGEVSVGNSERVAPGTASSWHPFIGNRLNEQHWFVNNNGEQPVRNSGIPRQPWGKSDSRRQHPWYGIEINGHSEQQWNNNHNTGQWLTDSENLNPSLLNGNFKTRPLPVVQIGNIGIFDNNAENLTPPRDSLQASTLAVAQSQQYSVQSSVVSVNRVSVDSSESSALTSHMHGHQNNVHTNKGSHYQERHSTEGQFIPYEQKVGFHNVKGQKSLEQLSCRIIELIREKRMEIHLNSSNDNFELSIKGQGGFSELLESIYHHSHVHNDLADRVESEPIMIKNLTEVNTNEGFPIDAKGLMFNGNDTHSHHTHSELKENSNVTREQDETILSSFTSYGNPLADDLISTHVVEETTHNPVIHQDSATDTSYSTSMENEVGKSSTPAFEESMEQINGSVQVDTKQSTELIPTMSSVEDEVILQKNKRNITESIKQTEGIEVFNEGTRSRRSLETPPLVLVQVLQSSQLSVLDLLQGRISFLKPDKSQEQLEVTNGSYRLVGPVSGNTQESVLGNENGNAIEGKEDMKEKQGMDILKKDKDREEQNSLETLQSRSSIIYHLGLMGSFNGNVGNIIPHVTNGHAAPVAQSEAFTEEKKDFPFNSNNTLEPSVNGSNNTLEPSINGSNNTLEPSSNNTLEPSSNSSNNTLELSSNSSNNTLEPSSNNTLEPRSNSSNKTSEPSPPSHLTSRKESPGEDRDVSTKLISQQHTQKNSDNNIQSDCPYDDIMKAQDIKIHLNTAEGGGFELSVQGNGGLYEVVKKFFHGSDMVMDDVKVSSDEEEPLL